MLEIDIFMKIYFYNEIERTANTIGDYDRKKCWLCEKKLESTTRCSEWEKQPKLICRGIVMVEDHCHLTGQLKWLVGLSKSNLNTQKSHTSFAPTLSHKFFGCHCHRIFEKFFDTATERKDLKKLGEIVIANPSENYILLRIGCLKLFGSLQVFECQFR